MVPFPKAAVDELEQALQRLRRDPLPLLLLSPAQFALSACAAVMTAVGRKLRRGVGLAVIDRIPVERFSADENCALYWLLGSLLGRPVAQKWDGTMIYDVRDTGKALEYGVRRSVTNLELQFHTDAPWLALPPERVGLLCLRPAPEVRVEFTIERGQIQYLNNLCVAHSRTRFKDAEEPHLKRHLIRLWHRNEGRRTFHG